MKKLIIALLCASMLLFGGYIALMAAFEGPIRVKDPDYIALDAQERTIDLPWYLQIVSRYEFTMESDDFSHFSYALPDIFESAVMDIVVDWEKQTCVLYAGEARAMEIIDVDFPDIIWK